MKDLKDFIKIADAFGKDTQSQSQQIQEGFADWLMDKLGVDKSGAEAIADVAKKQGVDTSVTPSDTAKPSTDTTSASTGDKTAKQIWDEIKAMRDAQPQGPERVRLSNLMNQINVSPNSGTSPEDAAKILAQAKGEDSQDASPQAQTTAPSAPETPASETPPSTGDSAVDVAQDDAARTAPSAPETPAAETPPSTSNSTSATGTGTGTGDSAADVAQDDAANAQAGGNNGSLLGRKLNVDAPNLMKKYNDGGKVADDDVKNLQTGLSRLGFDPNGLDGKYGKGTFKAVQDFQKKHGLKADGQAGPETMKKMKELLDANFAKSQGGAGDAISSEKPAASGAGDEAAAQKAIADKQKATDIERMNQLIAKGEAEGLDAFGGAGDPVAGKTESFDMRSLIALVEATLNEVALSQEEVAELQGLIAKYQDDAEFDKNIMAKAQSVLNKQNPSGSATASEPAGATDAEKAAGAGQATSPQTSAELDTDSKDNAAAPAEPKDLDALVDQIAKPGMKFADLEKLTSAAAAMEPKDIDPNSNIFQKLGNKAKQLLSTEDYRTRYAIAKAAQKVGADGLYKPDGKLYIYMDGNEPKGAAGANTDQALQVAELGLLPPSKVASIQKLADKGDAKFKAIIDAHNAATGAAPGATQDEKDAGAGNNPQGATPSAPKVTPTAKMRIQSNGQLVNFNIDKSQPYRDVEVNGKMTRVYGSEEQLRQKYGETKELNMKAITEASMNISMNGADSREVGELIRILQNAGMNSAPKDDAMPMPVMNPHDDIKHTLSMIDDEPMGPPSCSTCGGMHAEDSPCDKTVEEIVDEWDNSPEESYSDHQTMTHDLSGGINRQKKMYPAAQRGDNAMAVESIKNQLLLALEGKYKNDAQRKAIHANKMKKK